MTKIAIYGDSYGSSFHGWPEYLGKLYDNCTVTTFALGGSSANYSYLRFLETNEKYDIVIFLWTSVTRNGLIVKTSGSKKYTVHGFTENFSVVTEELKEEVLTNAKENITSYQTLKKYHGDLISEIDKSWVLHESLYSTKYPTKNYLENLAMRDSVKFKRPDSINIECFSLEFGISDVGLVDISAQDWLQFVPKNVKVTSIPYKEIPEKRPNHMTFEQNKEFAGYLYKHMKNEWFDIHSTFKQVRKYYTMSETLEESGFIL
jgi:hypothetical protein